MAIREITKPTLGKTKAGWRWDSKRDLWATWQVETNFAGKRHFQRGFLTEKEARLYLERIKTQAQLCEIGVVEAVEYPSVSELFALRLADIEHPAEGARAVRAFAKFAGMLTAGAKINQVSKVHFKNYADRRVSEGVTKQTANREINTLAKAFSSVPDYFDLPNWRKPAVFWFPVSRTGRTRIIEPEEYEKLLAYFLDGKKQFEKPKSFTARRRAGLILKFALMTGLRHGEICGIEKKKFNRARREVDVYRFKTKRWKMYAPLTETMIELLEAGAKLYPKGKYFFSADGKLEAGFYTEMKRACQKLEIPYGKGTDGGFVLHDARHTFSTILHTNLIDDKTTVEFTDNPTAIGNYQHSTGESRRRAMAIIERQFGAKPAAADADTELDNIFDLTVSGKLKLDEFKTMIFETVGAGECQSV